MKQLSTIQIKLLEALADGLCHNGNALGAQLGVSRTAVWKQIKQLINLGLPIIRLPKIGYRLPRPMTLLNEQTIKQHLLNFGYTEPMNVHLFASLDSTNRLLKDIPISSTTDVCCAETQTQGRGRFGRHWHSPFGENIYCSSRWHFNCDLSRLSGLSLVVSLAVVATLNTFYDHGDIYIKWPNDLLWQGKKLCGSLIEMFAESNGGVDVIIGIGLNVNSATNEHHLPDTLWCSLYEITGKQFDRNAIIASLMLHLGRYLGLFMEQGFIAFIQTWQQFDYLHGQLINVSQLSGQLSGMAAGVNEAGQLILIDKAGTIHHLSAGDTSLKPLNCS